MNMVKNEGSTLANVVGVQEKKAPRKKVCVKNYLNFLLPDKIAVLLCQIWSGSKESKHGTVFKSAFYCDSLLVLGNVITDLCRKFSIGFQQRLSK